MGQYPWYPKNLCNRKSTLERLGTSFYFFDLFLMTRYCISKTVDNNEMKKMGQLAFRTFWCLLVILLLQCFYSVNGDKKVVSTLCTDITDDSAIGVYNFPSDIRKLFLTLPWNDPCLPDNTTDCHSLEYPSISVYSIQIAGAEETPEHGWLRIRIRHKEPLKAFYLAGETDEKFESGTIGDHKTATGAMNQAKGQFFVFNQGQSQQCPISSASKFMILPCGGIGRSEYQVPNAIFYVNPSVGDWSATTIPSRNPSEVIPPVKDPKDFNFYYRFTDLFCNSRRFYFRLWALVASASDPKKFEIRPGRTTFITPKKFLGAPAPIGTSDGSFTHTCYNIMALHTDSDEQEDKVLVPDWVEEVHTGIVTLQEKETCQGGRHKSRFGNTFVDTRRTIVNYKDEVVNPVLVDSRCYWKNEILHPSDPIDAQQRTTDQLQLHRCKIARTNPVRDYARSLPTYDEYVEEFLEKNNWKCNCKGAELQQFIPEPDLISLDPIPKGVVLKAPRLIMIDPSPNVLSFNPSNNDNSSSSFPVKKGIKADVNIGKVLWRARVGHGIMMAIVGMLITPVGSFIARYYKETWMEDRILYFRVWTFVHFQSIPSNWAFIIGSLISIRVSRTNLGTSLTPEAYAHRIMGWLLILLYGLMTILGGVRFYDNTPRKISIASHAGFGMLFQYGCLVAMWLAVRIPGSPLADNDVSFETPKDVINSATIIIIVSFVLDCIFRAIVACNICKSDKELDITKSGRYQFPVMIPVVPEHTLADAPKSGFRKIMLGVHVLVALSLTVYISTNMALMSPIGRGFGPMSCTHLDTTTTRHHLNPNCFWSDSNFSQFEVNSSASQKS